MIPKTLETLRSMGEEELTTTAQTIREGINEVDGGLATHLAETAQKHITESGSNANGYYTKFDDGLVICWTSQEFTESPALANNANIPHRLFIPPVTFVNHPAISVAVACKSGTVALTKSSNLQVGFDGGAENAIGYGTVGVSAQVTNSGTWAGIPQAIETYDKTIYNIQWIGRWK